MIYMWCKIWFFSVIWVLRIFVFLRLYILIKTKSWEVLLGRGLRTYVESHITRYGGRLYRRCGEIWDWNFQFSGSYEYCDFLFLGGCISSAERIAEQWNLVDVLWHISRGILQSMVQIGSVVIEKVGDINFLYCLGLKMPISLERLRIGRFWVADRLAS